MLRSAILAGAISCALLSAAAAAPRHSVVPSSAISNCNAPVCEATQIAPVDRRAAARARASQCCFGTPMQPGETVQGFISGGISRPSMWVPGRLSCARNVNAWLTSQGRAGTGSDMALSFLGYGSPSSAVPGALVVTSRGRRGRGRGHVSIVSRVEGGQVYAWTSTGGWHEYAVRGGVYRY